MASIIDALVVTLSLDSSGFKRGSQQAQTEQKKLKDSIGQLEQQISEIRRKSTKFTADQDKAQIAGLREVVNQKKRSLTDNKTAEQEQTKRQKEQTELIGKMKNAAIEFFAVFAAGSSVKAFVSDLVAGDAATGRMAANLGESAQTATAFGAVIRGLGGSASEGLAAFANLAGIRFAEQAKGDYSKAPVLSRLGVSSQDLNNLDTAMGKIAATAKTMPKSLFYQYAKEAGFSDGAINALELGNVELAKQIELAKQRESLDQNWIALSQQIVTWLSNTRDTLSGVAREILSSLFPALKSLGSSFNDLAVSMGAKSLLGDVSEWKEFARELTALFNGLAASTRSLADDLNALNDVFHGDFKGAGAWLDKAKQDGHAMLGFMGSALSDGSGGSSAAGGVATGSLSGSLQSQRAAFAVDYLKSQGLSDQAARGAVAGSIAESRLDPNAVNASSGAFGIGQWLGARKAALFARFGNNPNFDQQLQFLASELNGGDRGGAAVRQSSSALAAMGAYVRAFMRPGPGTAGDLARGRQALVGLGVDPGLAGGAAAGLAGPGGFAGGTGTNIDSDVHIGRINVTVPPGSDGNRIAKETAAAVRNQPFVAMANTGLA